MGVKVLLCSPLVRAVHVLLKPGLEIPELMLHSVHHLHGCVQVSTTQTVVYYSPNRMALYLTVLLGTQRLNRFVTKQTDCNTFDSTLLLSVYLR